MTETRSLHWSEAIMVSADPVLTAQITLAADRDIWRTVGSRIPPVDIRGSAVGPVMIQRILRDRAKQKAAEA